MVSALVSLCQGPYKVLEANNKFFSLKIGGCTEVVSVDHLKPHLGCTDVALAHWVTKFLLLLSLVFSTALAGGGGGGMWRPTPVKKSGAICTSNP